MENLKTYRIIETETGILAEEFKASNMEKAKEYLAEWTSLPEGLTLEEFKPVEYLTFIMEGY